MSDGFELLGAVVNNHDPEAFGKLLCMPNEELDKIIDAWKEAENGRNAL